MDWRSRARLGTRVRPHCFIHNVTFGHDCIVEPYCRLVGSPRIIIGARFYANGACHFLGDIEIGDDVLCGPRVIVWARDHNYQRLDVPMKSQGHNARKIIIEDDVWLGAGAIVLKGVRVGRGSIVGAGSVVTKDVLPYSIVAGNPARPIGDRSSGCIGHPNA
jgi:acetyltransferase-like isoleucine patch superfamily enzyme